MYQKFVAPVLRQQGQPQVLEKVELDEPRGGEVEVRMAASGVCHSCISVADGSFGDVPLPMILGDEGSGVIERVGPDCRWLEPGDHVILSWAPSCGHCRFCTSGRPGICESPAPRGRMRDGTTRFRVGDEPLYQMGPSTYSPYVVAPESAAVKIDPAIPLDRAALIGCAVTTGVGAVLNTAKVQAGESVAVFGCGGVGLSAVQGAVLAGAHPIMAVDVVGSKLEIAQQVGATAVINAGKTDPIDWIRVVSSGGADHAIVAVGSTTVMEQALAALGPGGTCVLVGAAPFGQSISVDPAHLLTAERRLVGARYGSSNPHVTFPRLVELHMAGRLKLKELITRRYPLDQVNKASQALLDGEDVRGLLIFDH